MAGEKRLVLHCRGRKFGQDPPEISFCWIKSEQEKVMRKHDSSLDAGQDKGQESGYATVRLETGAFMS